MFRIMFQIKVGIYTNNVPLHHKRNLCATTKLVISVNCARSRGTICVDTLHHLCRVCAMSLLFKCTFYSLNIHFHHDDAFQRLIMFRIVFRVKGGIYTNNVPLHRKRNLCATTKLVISIELRSFKGAQSVQIPYIICAGLNAYFIHRTYTFSTLRHSIG